MKIAIFKGLCPNCAGDIESERLEYGLPCSKCLPKPLERYKDAKVKDTRVLIKHLCAELRKNGKLKGYSKFCEIKDVEEKFSEFFKSKVGSEPWSLQLTWIKRVIAKRSFAILAPTGVGKTTFGVVAAAFLPVRAYIIVPTKLLVQQVIKCLEKISDGRKKIVGFTGKESEKEVIAKGDFDILVTTHMFLYHNFDMLESIFKRPYSPIKNTPTEVKSLFANRFHNFFFVDDVDSFLKTSKNIDRILKLLGFNDYAIKLALKPDKTDKDYQRLQQIQHYANGSLVISSATAQPRSRRVVLFRELLGFEVQKSSTTLRNIVDVAKKVKDFQHGMKEAAGIIKQLGKGGFVYVSMDYGREGVEKLVKFFNSRGISSVTYEEFNNEVQEQFRNGKVSVVVGISHHLNPLVRGIDLPDAVRYAVFVGTPKMEIPVIIESLNPLHLFRLLLAIRPVLTEQERINDYLNFLREHLTIKEKQIEQYPRIKQKLEEIVLFIQTKLSDPNFVSAIHASNEVSLIKKQGQLFIVVGDTASYIQASGRTSRLFAGGLTKGLSILLYYNDKAFLNLKKRLREILNQDIEFVKLEELDLDTIVHEIDKDRERVRAILQGKLPVEKKDLMRTTLVIVESPNKARTIAGFFGRPQRRWIYNSLAYEVNLGDRLLIITASLGHVFDIIEEGGLYGVLDTKNGYIPIYSTIKRCTKCNEQTTLNLCPRCKTKPDLDKIDIIKALRELAVEVDEVIIATDPDAEGEKIAWDLFLSLKPFSANLRRAEFHEVTPRAFKNALDSLRDFDVNLVKAQIVRRIADRWIGFSLSQHLQKRFGRKNLSAGRVQTPVLGLVIKREIEIKQKKGVITAVINGVKVKFEIDDLKKARVIFKDLEKMQVSLIKESDVQIKPHPPFTTSTLLTAASETLGFSAEKTMFIAQNLFETGIITYHRTGSTRVSDAGLKVARNYIIETFGRDYLKLRRWGEGGAHECIRPTRPIEPQELKILISTGRVQLENPKDALQLYTLIWRRFIASQMRETVVHTKTLEFKLMDFVDHKEFITSIIKPGFNLVTPIKLVHLPNIKNLKIIQKQFNLVPKVTPFTQGTLIETMRKHGLGRPSTYAKIVTTLLERRYIVEHKNLLFPTKLGQQIYDYLTKRFQKWTSEEFTRYIEEQMDKVESNTIDYQLVLKEIRNVIEEASKK